MKYASVPFNQNENGWLNETSRTPRYPTLNQNTDADWVVIGSGYAGLSFARRLAHNNRTLKLFSLIAQRQPKVHLLEIQDLLLGYLIILAVQRPN